MPDGILQRIRQMTEVPVADSDPVAPQLRLPLTVLLLGASQHYEQSPSSLVFPFLPLRQFETFVHRMLNEADQNAVLADFQAWVRTLPAGRPHQPAV